MDKDKLRVGTKWCPTAGMYAKDGKVLLFDDDCNPFWQKCVEWPECRKCAAGEGCKCQKALLEDGVS